MHRQVIAAQSPSAPPSSPRERPGVKPGEGTHISQRCAIIAKDPGSEENDTSGIGADDEQYWPLTDGP
jgi:hypothetical protein